MPGLRTEGPRVIIQEKQSFLQEQPYHGASASTAKSSLMPLRQSSHGTMDKAAPTALWTVSHPLRLQYLLVIANPMWLPRALVIWNPKINQWWAGPCRDPAIQRLEAWGSWKVEAECWSRDSCVQVQALNMSTEDQDVGRNSACSRIPCIRKLLSCPKPGVHFSVTLFSHW